MLDLIVRTDSVFEDGVELPDLERSIESRLGSGPAISNAGSGVIVAKGSGRLSSARVRGDYRSVRSGVGRGYETRFTESSQKILVALLVVAVLPLGVSFGGLPFSPYHLVSPIAWLVLIIGGGCKKGRETREWAALHVGCILTSILVAFFYPSISPQDTLASAGHFLAPYFLIPAVGQLNSRRRLWLWEASIKIGATASVATIISAGLNGSATRGTASGRQYSIGASIPNMAGSAQVNTWATYLLGVAVLSLAYLALSPTSSTTNRLVAWVGSVTSVLAVVMSGSRANTVAAFIVVLAALFGMAIGKIVSSSKYRKLLIFGTVAATLVLGGFCINIVSQNARIISNVDRGASVSGQFRGRDDRISAMIEDLEVSPLIGTGFSDFSLRHPTLASSSPHFQWLGAFHKMGIPLGLFYIVLLVRSFRFRYSQHLRKLFLLLVCSVVVLLGTVYDLLTASPSGVTILLLISLVARHERLYAS